MSKRKIAGIILIIILALLFWSEFIFSALPSLSGIGERAEILGWNAGNTQFYFMGLALLDLAGGVGAILTLYSVIKKQSTSKIIHYFTLVVLIYAAVQFLVAFLFPSDLRFLYWAIGIAYALMAIATRTFLTTHQGKVRL